jgi:REP element-mobilizing transposase RayT
MVMARPLRVEYPGAIYHVMSRGNGRQRVFRDERDFQRLLEGLESAVRKFDWLVMSYVWMPKRRWVAETRQRLTDASWKRV